jgi:membrane protein
MSGPEWSFRVASRSVRFDREHLLTFARFLWQRFVDDKCFETAGALSYTTLFALVPLTAAVVGILSAFPVFSVWTQELTDFVFRSFVPAAGATVRDYLFQFAGNASKMTALGIVVLLASALMMMSAIEDRLNRIWRVEKRRSSVSRFLLYWAALTLGPILVVGGLALSSYLFALPILNQAASQFGLQARLLRLLPFLITLLAMLLLYMLVPNRRVAWRHAIVGALLAAVLFEFAKWGFALYVSKVPSYQQIYGALAVVPIFLIWIYVSWVIVLLGASIAASLSSFDYRPLDERLPQGAEFLGLLHVLKHFVAAQRDGRVLTLGALAERERFVSDDLLQRYLGDLHHAGLTVENEDHGWSLLRSLDSASLLPVYEAGGYRLPLDSATLARWSADLPTPLRMMLAGLAETLRHRLATTLAELFPPADTPSTRP